MKRNGHISLRTGSVETYTVTIGEWDQSFKCWPSILWVNTFHPYSPTGLWNDKVWRGMDILDRFSASFTRGFMFAFLNSAILSDTIVWLTTVGGVPISLWFRGAEKLDNNYGLHPGKYTLGLVCTEMEGVHPQYWGPAFEKLVPFFCCHYVCFH